MISHLNQISSSNTMVIDYIVAANLLLQQYSSDELSVAEVQWVQTMANNCVFDYGASVHLSRIICNSNAIEYTKPSNCSRVPKMINIDTDIESMKQVNTSQFIYPNPAAESIVLHKLPNGSTIEIVDIMGRVHLSSVISSEKRVDVANLDSGIYFIKYTQDGVQKSSKFIKL